MALSLKGCVAVEELLLLGVRRGAPNLLISEDLNDRAGANGFAGGSQRLLTDLLDGGEGLGVELLAAAAPFLDVGHGQAFVIGRADHPKPLVVGHGGVEAPLVLAGDPLPHQFVDGLLALLLGELEGRPVGSRFGLRELRVLELRMPGVRQLVDVGNDGIHGLVGEHVGVGALAKGGGAGDGVEDMLVDPPFALEGIIL